ncbi:TetR/AcrR family transcriptional regulator [Mycobacterium branderi]|nr:TetR/AcrR family transcriptional regulator [Mycobacterium branderi]MCV7232395.1 TetR/AcrR family transcriptional regulator [Mycobacterium branderi]
MSRARTARADERATDTRSRIMDALLPLAALTGLRKLSMDEVARYAKVGRATLYKYFPGRDALIAAFVQQELARFFADVGHIVERYDDPDERLIHSFAHAYRYLRYHPALSTILRVNPQILLPYVITEASEALDLGRQFVESTVGADELPDPERAQFGEHVARAIHTLILIPSSVMGLDAPDGPENYARRFLVPVKNSLAATLPA